MTVEAKRQARRAAMPITTAFVEQYADLAPTLIYARENGRKYGKPPQDVEVFDIPAHYRMATSAPKVKHG